MNKSIVFVLASAAAVIVPHTASAFTPEWTFNGGFMTFGGNEGNPGLCLDVFADQLEAGAQIDSATCNDSNAQKWQLNGLLGEVMSLSPSAAPGLCLGIPGNDPTQGRVTLEPCSTQDEGQDWQFWSGRLRAFNSSGYCLDVFAGQPNNSQPVDVAPCNGTPAQAFWPYGIPLSFPSIASGGSEALDVFGDSESPGGTVDDYNFSTDNLAQRFVLTRSHQIVHDNLCLNTVSYSGWQGNLAFEDCGGIGAAQLTPGQEWHFVLEGDPDPPSGADPFNATINLVNAQSAPGGIAECLDISGGNAAPSTPVDSFQCNGTPAQLWTAVIDFQ